MDESETFSNDDDLINPEVFYTHVVYLVFTHTSLMPINTRWCSLFPCLKHLEHCALYWWECKSITGHLSTDCWVR